MNTKDDATCHSVFEYTENVDTGIGICLKGQRYWSIDRHIPPPKVKLIASHLTPEEASSMCQKFN